MYNETTREMTDDERKVLQEQLASESPVVGRWTIQWASVWSAGFTFIVLLAIGLVMLKPNPISAKSSGIPACWGNYLSLCSVFHHIGVFRWRNHFGKFQNDIVPQIKRALATAEFMSNK